MPPSSVPRRSRAVDVASRIEDELLAARLAVGTHLGRRADFMSRFNVSPTVMSEVLRILRDRGLVSVRPGTGGGLFVASEPPQIRLGGMDLWFHPSSAHPLELFEGRVHLEAVLTRAAFERAGPADLASMDAAVADLEGAATAEGFLRAVMELHRRIAAASGITVLVGVHEALVAGITATLSRAEFVEGAEEILRHSRQLHAELVATIRDGDRARFAKISGLHDRDLIRAGDPRRSPYVGGTDRGADGVQTG